MKNVLFKEADVYSRRGILGLRRRKLASGVALAVSLLGLSSALSANGDEATAGIAIYEKNPFYWQYNGAPILPLGGTNDDSLFQIPNLKEHLNELVANGGNYIRNTMSSRQSQGFEVRAHKRLPNGKYDLDQWNDEFWERFENMLKLTEERDIIVQVEIWAFHDFFNRERHPDEWTKNPWNPEKNVNYTVAETILKSDYPDVRGKHDFFYTVPALDDDPIALKYQKRFVDKILEHSLRYDHVLYCMTNEIFDQFDPEWGWFWARHIKDRAAQAGKRVYLTEMYQQKDFTHPQHRGSLDHPEIYDFVETSQNSTRQDQENWDNLQYIRQYILDNPRPMNAVKIYGHDYGRTWGGNSNDGVERFWRNIIGGCATSRFHRPPTGMGLSERSKANMRSMRMFTEHIVPWEAEPRPDLLVDRQSDYAYLMAKPGEYYGIYFPNGRGVGLDLRGVSGTYTVRWLKIETSEWIDEVEQIEGGKVQRIQSPASSGWAAVITKDKI